MGLREVTHRDFIVVVESVVTLDCLALVIISLLREQIVLMLFVFHHLELVSILTGHLTPLILTSELAAFDNAGRI